MADSFNPSRLALARRRRGMTMTQLAESVGVDSRSISAYENGEFQPDGDRLVELADALDFPLGFFSGDDLEEPAADIASFRALTKMTSAQRNMALGAGAIALHLHRWLEERFELPQPDVPDLSKDADDPEMAAETLRSLWQLGSLPIKNVVHLLESKGVRVYTLAIDAKEVDAFSMWHGSMPFIFLNTKKSSERCRFDAAHELGHLVLHRHGSPQGPLAEKEANNFASAFLMPRSSVIANAPKLTTIAQLVALKKLWTVSVSALAYRLHALKVLTDWHYRALCIEMGKRGYQKNEPNSAPREVSQLLAKVFAALRKEDVTRSDIARELRIRVGDIDELVFGLTLTTIANQGPSAKSSVVGAPKLKIVSRDTQ